MKKFITALSLVLVTSAFASKDNIYTIEKGEHSSKGMNVGLFWNDLLSVDVRFDNSAIYDLGNSDQGDINKLIGFSDCLSHHHKNSARLGWRWNLQKEAVEIFAYVYANGKRESKHIRDIQLNEMYRMAIKVVKSRYYFTVSALDGSPIGGIALDRGCSKKKAVGYKLFPYFGGNEVAPNDVNIFVKSSRK